MNQYKSVVVETFEKLYSPEGLENCERIIANVKAIFEKVGVKSTITSRIKGPTSILKKLQTEDKYLQKWNNIKDLLGLMIVVESNQDIDKLIYIAQEELSEIKNPNSELLSRDYRKENYRNKNGMDDDSAGLYEEPSHKGYQIHNGYKNVRINLMIDDYPIEIQLKTKEQYIAHEATHDPVYKSPRLKDKNDETKIAGGLFPYFEASAHLELHKHEMTERQIKHCREDIASIFKRNEDLFNQYPEVFNDACRVYAVYMFILKNQDKIYAEQTLNGALLNMKLLESEILRIFNYKQAEVFKQDRALSKNEAFVKTINNVSNMSFEEFVSLRESLAGNHRMEKCVLIGPFNLVDKAEVEKIQSFCDSFRTVQLAIYDDELYKLIYGEPPMFSFDERKRNFEMLKGVSDVIKVGVSGKVEFSKDVAPMIIDEAQPKKYKYGYVTGVFDIFDDEHRKYLEEVIALCDKVIIGVKSDDFILNRGKTSVTPESQRVPVIESIRGIDNVVLTEYDIGMPKQVREVLLKEAQNGEKCAIFAGHQWFAKNDRRRLENSEELHALIGFDNFRQVPVKDLEELYKSGDMEIPTIYDNVVVACLPRDEKAIESKRKKTAIYRKNAKFERDNLKYEVITMGEEG